MSHMDAGVGFSTCHTYTMNIASLFVLPLIACFAAGCAADASATDEDNAAVDALTAEEGAGAGKLLSLSCATSAPNGVNHLVTKLTARAVSSTELSDVTIEALDDGTATPEVGSLPRQAADAKYRASKSIYKDHNKFSLDFPAPSPSVILGQCTFDLKAPKTIATGTFPAHAKGKETPNDYYLGWSCEQSGGTIRLACTVK